MKLIEDIRDVITGIKAARAMGRAKSWSKLWETSQELRNIFGNKVTSPYTQVSSVYKAVKAIADNVPQAELKFYDYSSGKETWPKQLDNLIRQPNPLQSWNDFLQKCIGFLALKGELFIVKTPSIGQVAGTSNLPAELWTFNPNKFKEIKSGGQLTGWRYGQIEYGLEEVIHIKDFNPDDDFRGLPPTKAIDKIIDIDYQSLVYNKAFFDNNGLPNAYIIAKEGLSDAGRKTLEEWLKKKFTGASKAFKTAILEGDIDIKTIAQSHKDMEFIKQKQFTREEILGTWRAPKALFNITDDLNYATFMGQMKIFWLYGLMPMLRKFEDGLNRHLIWTYDATIYCKFDLSQVPAFQEDLKEKVETGKKLQEMGFTANEINEKLGLGFDNKPWRDKWWISMSMLPAGEGLATDPAPSPDGDKSVLPKSIKSDKKLDGSMVWKRFVRSHTPIEEKMANALKKYFFDQRKEVLAQVESKGITKDITIDIDWDDQDDALIKKIGPFLKGGLDEGVKMGEEFIPSTIDDNILANRINSYFKLRCQDITKVNQTIKDQLRLSIMEGTDAGETTQQIADRVRHIYNMASTRAKTIARTEVTGTMNAGSTIYYDAAGVKQKQWVIADGEARPTHQACADQGSIRMNESFVNGMDFPGGAGPAEEVINCRCTLIPVISTGD